MVSPDKPSSQPRKPVAQVRYELLTLGDELLLGTDGQQPPDVHRGGARPPRRDAPAERHRDRRGRRHRRRQLRESWAAADVVITTGGLGPTCDDRTREAVAAVLGLKLVFDPAIEKAIAERFALFGRRMTPNNLKQAYRFERGEVLPNANGTAPGLWIEQDGKVLCMLPGPAQRAPADVHRAGRPPAGGPRAPARPGGLRPDPHRGHRRVDARDQAPADVRPPRGRP